MSNIDPVARLAIAQLRSQAYSLECVALDLEANGLSARATIRRVETLRRLADDSEQTERSIVASADQRHAAVYATELGDAINAASSEAIRLSEKDL